MSSKDKQEDHAVGYEAAGTNALSSTSTNHSAAEGDENMKRAAAKHRIEQFYYQLTDGCGDSNCTNIYCASSRQFCYQGLDRNLAAARALELFKNKRPLCSASKPNKVARSAEVASDASTADATVNRSLCHPVALTTKLPTAEASSSVSATSASTVKDAAASGSTGFSGSLPSKSEYLTEKKLESIIEDCQQTGSWSRLKGMIFSVFSDPEALMSSFLKGQDTLTKEDIRSMEVDQDKDQDEKEETKPEEEEYPSKMTEDDDGSDLDTIEVDPTFDCSSTMGELVVQENFKCALNMNCSSATAEASEVTLDVESLQRAYTKLFSLEEQTFQSAMLNAITYLSRNLETDLRSYNRYMLNPNYINIFIIIMEIPQLSSLEYLENSIPQFCKTVGLLPMACQVRLARYWSTYTHDRLLWMVCSIQQMITVKMITNTWSRTNLVNDDDGITGAVKLMKLLYYACLLGGKLDPPETLSAERELEEEEVTDDALQPLQDLFPGGLGREHKEKVVPRVDPLEKLLNIRPTDCREPLVSLEEFVNESLSEAIEMDKDYAYYRAESPEKFSFMMHPFILTTAVKNMGMYFDNRIRMLNERRASLFQSVVHGNASMPYLRLRIRRDHIIDDALVNLEMIAMDNPQDLKKQLFVEFEGEQGIDEGGVSKEFFQLVVEEIFNPDIGMFRFDEETKTFWFNPTSFENDGQFTLIGIVLGLAIYNNVILDIHFPMVVYRKLFGKLGTFEDLKASHPTLASSLEQFLQYEGEVSEAFMQPFSVSSTDVFGHVQTQNLKPNGDQIIVTNETRKEFVDLYANFLLNKSVDKQFRAFKRGFHMVTDESPLKLLFNPKEIELLVCGSKNFDFQALEEATEYDGGFTSDSTTIRYFWEVVHEFTDDQKRQLLQFTTGSDRVPIGGLSKLKLIVARNGPDSDRLPTSHTCFNVLLLPEYTTREKLRERLLKAITYSKGFGML